MYQALLSQAFYVHYSSTLWIGTVIIPIVYGEGLWHKPYLVFHQNKIPILIQAFPNYFKSIDL